MLSVTWPTDYVHAVTGISFTPPPFPPRRASHNSLAISSSLHTPAFCFSLHTLPVSLSPHTCPSTLLLTFWHLHLSLYHGLQLPPLLILYLGLLLLSSHPGLLPPRLNPWPSVHLHVPWPATSCSQALALCSSPCFLTSYLLSQTLAIYSFPFTLASYLLFSIPGLCSSPCTLASYLLF